MKIGVFAQFIVYVSSQAKYASDWCTQCCCPVNGRFRCSFFVAKECKMTDYIVFSRKIYAQMESTKQCQCFLTQAEDTLQEKTTVVLLDDGFRYSIHSLEVANSN